MVRAGPHVVGELGAYRPLPLGRQPGRGQFVQQPLHMADDQVHEGVPASRVHPPQAGVLVVLLPVGCLVAHPVLLGR